MSKNFPFLKTDRLFLRQFIDSDINHVFRGLSHPEIIRYYGVSYDTLVSTKVQMSWFKSLEEDNTGIWWAICDTRTESFYGAIGLNNLSLTHRKAEIGFWLLPAYWGMGIIQDAVGLVCEYGFEHVKLHRIEALIETENKNCKNLMNKLNFNHEGTMQDCEIKNGDFISLDIYAKFNNPY